MSIADVYYEANEQIRLSDLEPINKKSFKNLPKDGWEEQATISYENWKAQLQSKGYDVRRIHLNKNQKTMNRYFYVGEYFTSQLHFLDPEYMLGDFCLPIIKVDEQQREKFEAEDYTLLFFPEWNMFAIDYFIRLYKKIPKEKVWDVFVLVYTNANFGFSMFPKEVLEDMFVYADTEEAIQRLMDKGVADKDGYLTLYRGTGARSTSLEGAYSWTLSIDVAKRFAHHFERGVVYQAKAKVEDVITYQEVRDEEEIIVRYNSLEQIEIIED